MSEELRNELDCLQQELVQLENDANAEVAALEERIAGLEEAAAAREREIARLRRELTEMTERWHEIQRQGKDR